MSDPIQVVTGFLKAMEAMNFDLGVAFVAPNIEYINSPGTAVSGPEGVRAVLEPFFAPIEENEFVIRRQIAQDNCVVVERVGRHRIAQNWFELPVTGIFEVEAGKIVYWREYFDMETIRTSMENLIGGAQ